MSELGDIHEKINAVGGDVREMKGLLKATLPTLATRTEVGLMVSEHKEDCRKSRDRYKRPSLIPSPRISYKKYAGIGGALAALAGAIYALAQAIQ